MINGQKRKKRERLVVGDAYTHVWVLFISSNGHTLTQPKQNWIRKICRDRKQ